MDDAVLEILDFVKLKGSLKSHVLKEKIIELISDRIKSAIPHLASLSGDLELLKVICNCVENVVLKKHKMDKKEIALAIIKSCFPAMPQKDLDVLSNNIDSIHASGLIKKVSVYKKLKRYLFSSKKKD